MSKTALVRNAMLAVQRYPWEQGTCMQALYEMGDIPTMIAMAHDAILRQQPDGRLAVTGDNIAVTDPAANGEGVWRAYELTGDSFYKEGATRMLDYLLCKAPRTVNGTLCHNEISFEDGFSPDQIWADSIYMAPPFLAVMGHIEEAEKQINGMMDYLCDPTTGLLYHIYDAGRECFVRRKLWATGNGWALLGMGRVIEEALKQQKEDIAKRLTHQAALLLEALLPYQLPDGRFHDILDDPDSFIDGASAMMTAAFIYRAIAGGYLSSQYKAVADRIAETMEEYVDDYGIIHGVCGCPHFISEGTSAESMAAYLMMHAYKEKC